MASNPNSKISERLAILGTSLPAAATTGGGTVTSSLVNIVTTAGNLFQRFLGIAWNSATNVWTANVVKATSATGTQTVILTQTNSGTTAPFVEFDINGNTQALNDTAATFIGVQSISTAGLTVQGALLLAEDGRYDPAFSFNSAAVNANIPAVV